MSLQQFTTRHKKSDFASICYIVFVTLLTGVQGGNNRLPLGNTPASLPPNHKKNILL